MKEYYKNPEETKKSFNKDWFLTGDLGYMDEENYVFVKGRIKELIIKGGENISPREIDDVLYQHPAVLEAAAFAVKCEHYGEKIEAGIVLKKTHEVMENELIKHCENLIGKLSLQVKYIFFQNYPKDHLEKYKDLKFRTKLNEKAFRDRSFWFIFNY